MNRYRLVGQRLAVLAFIDALLFNYPILSLFSVDRMILGVPLLYAYLFTVWLLFIGLMAWFIERSG
jgi:hypothetical protein